MIPTGARSRTFASGVSNQLRELRSEIEDDDSLMSHCERWQTGNRVADWMTLL
jgi:hypothetical protein